MEGSKAKVRLEVGEEPTMSCRDESAHVWSGVMDQMLYREISSDMP